MIPPKEYDELVELLKSADSIHIEMNEAEGETSAIIRFKSNAYIEGTELLTSAIPAVKVFKFLLLICGPKNAIQRIRQMSREDDTNAWWGLLPSNFYKFIEDVKKIEEMAHEN